jgi:hypothetical protein
MHNDMDPAIGVLVSVLLCIALWLGLAAIYVRWWM